MKKFLLAVLFALTTPSFAVAAPAATITSPNGGESYNVGEVMHITWSSTDVDKVTLMYQSSSGVVNYIATGIANTGSYDWAVNVGNTANTQFKIEIVAYQSGVGSVIDYSDNYFTVGVSGTINVAPAVPVTPAPTVTFTASPASIQSGGSSTLSLSSINASSCSSNGFVWDSTRTSGTVVVYPTQTTTYSIACVGSAGSASGTAIISVTPVNAAQSTPVGGSVPTIRVTAPNGGETITVGSVAHITWESTNAEKVDIRYQANSGTVGTVANAIANTGSYDWTVNVGNTTNTQFKIYITAYTPNAGGTATDYSDGYFTVPSTQSAPVNDIGDIVTPYLLDIDSITSTSISPRLNVNTNGAKNGRVRFQVQGKNGNVQYVVKTVYVPVPSIKTMYMASTTIDGLIPSTSYRLLTQTETDKWIFYPEFGRSIDFTTKAASTAPSNTSQQNTAVIVAPPSQSTVASPVVNSTTTKTVDGCTSAVGFSTTTGKPCTSSSATTQNTAKLTSIDQFGQGSQAQESCVDLQNNLSYRSRDLRTNGEVSELQNFLIAKKYLSVEATGYFGLMTVTAVKKFQSAVGIGSPATPGYGGIGPKSRAKIKETTCSIEA